MLGPPRCLLTASSGLQPETSWMVTGIMALRHQLVSIRSVLKKARNLRVARLISWRDASCRAGKGEGKGGESGRGTSTCRRRQRSPEPRFHSIRSFKKGAAPIPSGPYREEADGKVQWNGDAGKGGVQDGGPVSKALLFGEEQIDVPVAELGAEVLGGLRVRWAADPLSPGRLGGSRGTRQGHHGCSEDPHAHHDAPIVAAERHQQAAKDRQEQDLAESQH